MRETQHTQQTTPNSTDKT